MNTMSPGQLGVVILLIVLGGMLLMFLDILVWMKKPQGPRCHICGDRADIMRICPHCEDYYHDGVEPSPRPICARCDKNLRYSFEMD